MAQQSEIRAALERVAAVLEARPAQGKSTKSAESEWVGGLKATWRTGDWEFSVDNKKVMGGDESAPSPGAYARGALAACLVQGYAMILARRSMPVSSIKVRVETDSDAGGILSIEGAFVGFSEIRYFVDVQSSADASAVQEAIDEANRGDTLLHAFMKPVEVKGQVRIQSVDEAVGSN